jgi:chaperone BCS1
MMRAFLEALQHNAFFSGGLSLMVIGSVAAFLRKLPWQIWSFLERRLSISVEVPDHDPAFFWVQTWLAEQRYARRARDLSLTTTWERPDSGSIAAFDPDFDCSPPDTSQARFLLSPAPGMHLLIYAGRPLLLVRTRRELQTAGSTAYRESLTLQILCGSRNLVEALLKEAHGTSLPRKPGVSVLTARNEAWTSSSWQPRRPLESLVLADQLLTELLDDLREFYRSATWYAERGIPYRRGYLLHGPPGSGKTTLVLAVSGELKLSVAVLTLSDRQLSDESLRTLVDALPAATILLIEDVDCVFKQVDTRATTSATGVTLSGLLNALDGVSSREGRVLFMTTNHPERLDPALLRPGRVDRPLELGHATPDQARRLFLWYHRDSGLAQQSLACLAERFAAQVPRGRVSMAAIQEHLLRHRRSPEAAAHEVLWEQVNLETEPLTREEPRRA